ncbi:hypothetical protein [Rhodococcus pseudokoreensis]|nr:hypothetical protein [Rhodococcus pseudokoreensis]
MEYRISPLGERSLAMSMDTLRTRMLRRKPLTENPDLVRNA